MGDTLTVSGVRFLSSAPKKYEVTWEEDDGEWREWELALSGAAGTLDPFVKFLDEVHPRGRYWYAKEGRYVEIILGPDSEGHYQDSRGCFWRESLENGTLVLEPEAPSVDHSKLATYLIDWLETRNGGELRDPLQDMRVRDRVQMHEELTMILTHGGKPPNWS